MVGRDTDVTGDGGAGAVVSEGSQREALDSLEAAERYLREAENVLWTAATAGASEERREELEDLTQELWEVQHQLEDLQGEFDG